MTPQPRFADKATTEAERTIAQAASVAPHRLKADGWDDVMVRAVTSSPNRAALLPAFFLSFALGVATVLMLKPVQPAPPATVAHATAGTRWSSKTADEVVLESGRLSVTTPSGAPLRVRTPHCELEVTRSRFLAEVLPGGTTLWVEEGEAVLRSNGTTRVVSAGQSLTWPPAPVIPTPLLALAPPLESRCASRTPLETRACLRNEAAGASLEAQAALYELGSFEVEQGALDDGLHAWRESLERFPKGVLHPEVRLALLISLVKARRFSEASAAASDFETNCAGDPRAADVKALRRQLED